MRIADAPRNTDLIFRQQDSTDRQSQTSALSLLPDRPRARPPRHRHHPRAPQAASGTGGGSAGAGPVHLVGHSFGGVVALAVALRNRVALESLAIVEAPAIEVLRECDEHQHYGAFRQMAEAYFADFAIGNKEAIASMIDFYGGSGTYASWPPRVRAYAVETTPVNILDWASAFGFALSQATLAAVKVPTLVARGGASHPAMQRANELIATHAAEVARAVARQVRGELS